MKTPQSPTAVLLASDEHEGTIHTIVPEFASKVQAQRHSLEVATVSLDELAGRHSIFSGNGRTHKVVIKIDAEGAELDILHGASRTLAQPSLMALIVELIGSNGGGQTGRSKECVEILRAAGFTIRVLTQKIGARRIDQKGRALRESDLSDELNILAQRVPAGID